MSERQVLHRTFTDVAIDATDDLVRGRIVPYGIAVDVSDGGAPYREEFAPGAFRNAVRAAREAGPRWVRLEYEHQRSLMSVVGRAVELSETPSGLDGAFRLTPDDVGRHARALIDEEIVNGFSVAFVDLSKRPYRVAGVVIRRHCHLESVGLVERPAYADAVIERAEEAFEPAALEELRYPANPELDARLRALRGESA